MRKSKSGPSLTSLTCPKNTRISVNVVNVISPSTSQADLVALGSMTNSSVAKVVGCLSISSSSSTSTSLSNHEWKQTPFPPSILDEMEEMEDVKELAACIASPDEDPTPNRIVERNTNPSSERRISWTIWARKIRSTSKSRQRYLSR
jgi:hypothetical protein